MRDQGDSRHDCARVDSNVDSNRSFTGAGLRGLPETASDADESNGTKCGEKGMKLTKKPNTSKLFRERVLRKAGKEVLIQGEDGDRY